MHLLHPPGHQRVRRLPLPQAEPDEKEAGGEAEADQGTRRQGEQRGGGPIAAEGGAETLRRQDLRGKYGESL